jgi:hypothetical protein
LTELTRAGALRAAWHRILQASSLQSRWGAATDALLEALDTDLDPALLMRFMNRARRLAHDIPQLEPEYAAHMSGSLPYIVATAIAVDVLEARAPMDPPARAAALFDALLWNLVDDDEELA